MGINWSDSAFFCINNIAYLNSNKEMTYNNNIMPKSRKLTEEDLFGTQVSESKVIYSPANDLQKYNNVEYGAKKRIKP